MVVSSANHMGGSVIDKLVEYTGSIIKLLGFKSWLSHFRADLYQLFNLSRTEFYKMGIIIVYTSHVYCEE